jgi:hypothetical protein
MNRPLDVAAALGATDAKKIHAPMDVMIKMVTATRIAMPMTVPSHRDPQG